ncbi:MAG: hypothetical protein LBM70_01120 [Victivallales bacterium]|jgi:hypothetical protein|nr:hypothetical protein [Victivallales bacterium]
MMFFLGGYCAVASEAIIVKTRATENKKAQFHYRVPKNYDENRRESYRVLVIFGGRNTDGKGDAAGRMGWGAWCDSNDIFILSPGLKNDEYWQPREWSGKALLQALAALKKKYNVCTSKLLYYGYSAGSQASNLFPAWRPDMARAWVSHACGVFHEPNTNMRDVPGLVTCGDADKSRYIISRNFVEASRKKGVEIIWKSFPNHPHDVPPDSLKLARAFLEFHHRLHIEDLGGRDSDKKAATEVTVFIGDDQEHVYYPADSAKAQNVLPEDRVTLPNQTIANAWGKPE